MSSSSGLPSPSIPASPSTSITPKRRGSHVGEISLGDTDVPALSTMPLNPKREEESRRRVRALSSVSNFPPIPASENEGGDGGSYSTSSSSTSDAESLGSGSGSRSGISSGASISNTSAALRSSNNPVASIPQKLDPNNTTTTTNNNNNITNSKNKVHSKRRHHRNKNNNEEEEEEDNLPLSSIQRAWYAYQELSYRNSWLTPFIILAIMISAFELSPDKSPNNPLHMFLRLSYKITPEEQLTFWTTKSHPYDIPMYGKGVRDFAFVFTGTVFFMFFREFCMQVLLRPLARLCGLQRRNKISRFMEQTYSILYFSLSSPFGLYIMYHNPDHMWYYNTRSFYENYPHRVHDVLFKTFYLLQAGFWAQQSLVLCLQLEKPRRDFKELVFHHIVTMALIFLSYRFHFAMMGIAVFITMDVSDIFLSLSKTLNYLDSIFTPPMFIIFVGIWIYTRHYLNIKILYSVLTEFRTVGIYTLSFPMQEYKCWISQIITFVLLLALQLVNLYWLFLILRIMYRLISAGEQKDDRSDDEDTEEEQEYNNNNNFKLEKEKEKEK